MSMNLREKVNLTFAEDEASKKAAEVKKLSKILKNFEASSSIFNPSSEAVEDLKEKFIESSLKEEAKKEENPWAVMRHRITKAQEQLVMLRRDHPDTIHDCLFGCNEINFCFDDMNIGDLCYIVHKSLNELIHRINHRDKHGEFEYIPPHYDTRKVAKDANGEADDEEGVAKDANAEADDDAGVGAGAANDISAPFNFSYKWGAIVLDV